MVDIVKKRLDELSFDKELLENTDDREKIAYDLAEFEAMQARDLEEFQNAQRVAHAEKEAALNEQYAENKAQKLHDIEIKIDFARSLIATYANDAVGDAVEQQQ